MNMLPDHTATLADHGTAAAAMRGCDCVPCLQRLQELAGEHRQPAAQLELPYEANTHSLTGGPAVPSDRWVPLPAGLVPTLPAGLDAGAGSVARHDVLARAASPAEATRLLLAYGLAAPALDGCGGVR